MTPEQTGAVLAKMSVYDQRNVSSTDVLAWHEIIGHLDLDECLHAVRVFYAEHADRRATPADIRKLATDRRVRERGAADRRARELQAARAQPIRTGAAMCKFVLGRLRAAGSNPEAGQRLGRERAGDVAEDACREWLDLTAAESSP